MKRKHLPELAQLFAQFAACGDGAGTAAAVAEAMAVDTSLGAGSPVRELAALLAVGATLPDAMAEMPATFGASTVTLVRNAMAQGQGVAAFELLAADYRSLDRQQREAWSGLTYPMLLLLGVVLLLLESAVFIMPAYSEYFASFGGKLPALTRFMIGALPALATLMGALAVGMMLLFLPRTGPPAAARVAIERILHRLGGVRRYHQHAAEPRLVQAIAVAVGAGLPLHEVVAHLSATSSGLEARLLGGLQSQLVAGLPFGAACQAVPGLSRRMGAMATIAEGSGRLADSLSRMGSLLAEQGIEQRARWRRRVAVSCYVFTAVVVALCVISLYLPVFMLGGT
ncbi:MAG: type II secretion system F family protein [Burkholderiales bacterium]|nr:type II secretion system F family protein [Burkholderiales bacterium]